MVQCLIVETVYSKFKCVVYIRNYMVDLLNIFQNLKSNERKLDIIDEKNNRFLEFGQELKEGDRQIIENQEKLLQQNEAILAMLSK